MSQAQITTIHFFSFKTFRQKLWGFSMMQFAHRHLKDAEGLSFYKVMGSGAKEGFNPRPDWSTYSLLMVWKDEAFAQKFIAESQLLAEYREKTSHIKTFFLSCIRSKGSWSGFQPFTATEPPVESNAKIAVITRATIKFKQLYAFWKFVPKSRKAFVNNPSIIFSKGIGEIPLLQMATFSVWESAEAIQKAAYRSKGHVEAIRKTKKRDWYSEELFARFVVLRSE